MESRLLLLGFELIARPRGPLVFAPRVLALAVEDNLLRRVEKGAPDNTRLLLAWRGRQHASRAAAMGRRQQAEGGKRRGRLQERSAIRMRNH